MFGKKYILDKSKVKAYDEFRPSTNKRLPVCLAAFKSLRFMPEGNITVCCHNNSYVLGKYPAIAPLEAWESGKMKFLRKKLSKADFSAGCQSCFYAFEKQTFDSANPLLYENYEMDKLYPVILDFKIATECNLKCIMCSEYSSSSIRNESHGIVTNSVYDDAFIESISDFIPHLQEARFSGGEPFMNDIYFKLWDKIITLNPGCKIFIQTNGTLLNSKIKALLEKGNFHINVSVDALNPILYSKIRVNANIDQTISNIAYFADYSLRNNRKFGITSCAMRDNIQEWAELVNFANKYKASIWFSEVYFPFVNALWLMTSDEIENALDSLANDEILIICDLDQHNANLYYNLVAKLKDISQNYKERKHRKQFIGSQKLKQKLEGLFADIIVNNFSTWKTITEILDQYGDSLFYDFTNNIIDDYNSEFVYNHLSKMNFIELQNNFKALMLK